MNRRRTVSQENIAAENLSPTGVQIFGRVKGTAGEISNTLARHARHARIGIGIYIAYIRVEWSGVKYTY